MIVFSTQHFKKASWFPLMASKNLEAAALEGRPGPKWQGKARVAAGGNFPSSDLNKPISWESKVPPPQSYPLQ